MAELVGAYVVYPEQSVAANPNRCWNWFLAEHQQRDRGEPAAIVSLVNDVVARYPIDRSRIFVTGLSAGGALAAILAEQAPDLFAAAGIVAGVALHTSHDMASAFAAMRGNVSPATAEVAPFGEGHARADYTRLRVAIWTGVRDRVVAPLNAIVLAEQFRMLLGVEDRFGVHEIRDDAEIVRFHDREGRVRIETWQIPSMAHAWSGGSFRGSHTHPHGPRASDELMAFFLNEPSLLGSAARQSSV
ncbi:MAG: hypothetical protein NVS3B17_10240 [Vulcanimicrobiaceae bacterium]